MDATGWDQRYAASGAVWSDGPNALFAEIVSTLEPGTAIDVASGEGRNALWLAEQGWTVTAVDFSQVGLERSRDRALERHVTVDWQLRDVTTDGLTAGTYDLVALIYLHLPEAQMNDVLASCAAAVAPGGHLLVIGHDRDNLHKGVGGPQQADLLHTVPQLSAAADADGLRVQRCEQVERQVTQPDGTTARAIDVVLVATRTP